MSLESFKGRVADNVPGKFYVGDCCTDCDLCRETAPSNFARNDEGGYSFVKKQPETPEEDAACREAMEGCCTETIRDDGDQFDWSAHPAPVPYHLTPEGLKNRSIVKPPDPGCCCKSKPADQGPQI